MVPNIFNNDNQAVDFATTFDGTMYVVFKDQQQKTSLSRYWNAKWETMPSASEFILSISVDRYGQVWTTDVDGSIFSLIDDEWILQ